MKKLELILRSSLAGLFIGLVACIYVTCVNTMMEPFGKIVGAILFTTGLIAVIFFEAYLFTGKIGYVNNGSKAIDATIGLIVNLLTAFLVGLIYRWIMGVQIVMDTRLAKSWYTLLVDGIGCGICIYLSVELYRLKPNLLLVMLPVIAFIFAGFEHVVADACYFGMSELTWKGLLDLLIVALGNAIGSLLIRGIQVGCLKLKERNEGK